MHLKSTTFILFALTLIVLAVIHHLAVFFYLYWTYLWFDNVMHFLGGVVVALGFLNISRIHISKDITYGLICTLGVVFLVGAAWEIFEYVAGISIHEMALVTDTTFDFIFDLLGGASGYAIARMVGGLDS